MECPNCKKNLADNAKSCPECGFDFSEKKKKNPLMGCLSAVGVIFVLTGVFAGVGMYNAEDVMQDIQKSVADDAVAQYNIAKQQGDKIQICVQAGLVSASFLQAKDQENYNKWKAIEKSDCKKAGMPY